MVRLAGWFGGLPALVLACGWPIRAGWSQTDLSAGTGKAFPVAVLSAPAAAGEADFLSAGLSGMGIAMLERTDLAALVEEGALVSGKLPSDLAGAEALVVVEVITVENADYLATRVVRRRDGQILSSDLRKREGFETGWTQAIATEIRAIQKGGVGPQVAAPKVAIRMIREEFEAGKAENELLGAALTRLINAELSRRSEIRLLERQDLALIQFERFLVRIDSETFEAADFVVTGSVRRRDGSSRYDLRIESPKTNLPAQYEGMIPSEDLGRVAEGIAERLAKHLPADLGRQGSDSRAPFASDEAHRFASEAERCLRLGLHESAAAFAETAYLLDQDQSPRVAYVQACADLLAVLPGMRGMGVEVSQFLMPRTGTIHQAPDDAFYEALFQDGGAAERHPLPSRDQWSAIVLAAERVGEVAARSGSQQDPKSKGAVRTAPLQAGVRALARGALSNVRKRYGESIPDFERDILLRLAKPVRGSPDLVPGSASEFLFGYYDSLFLSPSREAAVDLIRNRLYGIELAGLGEGVERDLASDWRKLQGRGEPFAYFEHQGLDSDAGDSSGVVIDENLPGSPFVAALSGAGQRYEEAFAAAVDSAPERYRPLAGFDRLLSRFAAEKAGETRSQACDEARRYLMENRGPLLELGMLEASAVSLALLEKYRKVSPTYRAADYWREMHRVVHANDAWTSGNLSRSFLSHFDGSKWTTNFEEKADALRPFLDAIGSDVAGNGNPFTAKTREKIGLEIATKRESLAPALNLLALDPELNGAMECPEEETINLGTAFWSYQQRTLATSLAEDGFYIFQHGDAERDRESRLVRFEFNGQFAEVSVPREIRDLVDDAIDRETLYQLRRPGAMEVDSQRVALAFPGGVAEYDRVGKKWSVRAEPFLKGRHGMAFLGDFVVSYTGQMGNSAEAAPVQGLYLTSRKTFEHQAVIDTSRRPEKTFFDQSRRLVFRFPPFPVGADEFLIGLGGIEEIWRVEMGAGAPRVLGESRAGGFTPGFGASVGGNRANGSLHVVAIRSPSYKAPDDPFHVGAFSVNGQGEYICLLDTGTVSQKSAEKSTIRNRRLFGDAAEPRFEFPAEWRHPSGKSDARPLIHFDGSRLLLLTNQLTSDGRRLLYVWDDANRKKPRRFALRFNGFPKEEPEWRYRSNAGARESVTSIFRSQEFLCFEFDIGVFYLPVSELEDRLKR